MRIKTYNNPNNFLFFHGFCLYIFVKLFCFKLLIIIILFFLQIGELAGLAIGSTIIIDILFAGY